MNLFNYLLQIIIGVFIFGVSSFIAWYEGSAIVEDSLEWKYTTPFTKMFGKEITNGFDISQLDYFVYAVKFQPIFPTIMIISSLYILSVTGYYLLKSKSKWTTSFWGLIGILLILLSGFIFTSATIGHSIFFWITFISGLLFIAVAVLLWNKNRKLKLTVTTIKMSNSPSNLCC